MKIAFVRVDDQPLEAASPVALRRAQHSAKASSSSKNVILSLQQRGLATECAEWRFWQGSPPKDGGEGLLPVRDFSCDVGGSSAGLARYISAAGEPDILWVEGRAQPPYLRQAFDLCPNSFKVNYSKHWRPWKVTGLDSYQLSLIDEEWQATNVTRRYPSVHAATWDKVVDYDGLHRPVDVEKSFDICYVAYLRRRKNHELLLRAISKLPERRLTAVFLGGGRGHRDELERLAGELGVDVQFAGEVAKPQVNLYINRSRIGVLCARKDAAPRAILEYMAADVPVLVNAELMAGKRYVGPGAGLVRSPEEFHLGIAGLLDNLEEYEPRAYLLQHYSREKSVERFQRILEQAGFRER